MQLGCGMQPCQVPAANGIDLGVWHHGGHHPLLAPWYQGISGYVRDELDDTTTSTQVWLQFCTRAPYAICFFFCEKSQLRPSIPGAVLVCLGCI